MSAYTVIFDGLPHLGPGDPETTRRAVERVRPDMPQRPRVADFGCGVGASALVLAQSLPGVRVLALDAHPPFIERLVIEARDRGLGDRLVAVAGDMAAPPLLDGVSGEFDLIWSESAIYSIGRASAFACWHPLLNPGGWLVFSDIVWQSKPGARSGRAAEFWRGEYPDIASADDVVNQLAGAGFEPVEPMFCGRKSWSGYYEPLRERLGQLKKRKDCSQALVTLIAEIQREIDIYDAGGDEVALVFFLARRCPITE